jgi:hypothetical protein
VTTPSTPLLSADDFLTEMDTKADTVQFIREVYSSCLMTYPGYFRKNISIETKILIGFPVMVKVRLCVALLVECQLIGLSYVIYDVGSFWRG